MTNNCNLIMGKALRWYISAVLVMLAGIVLSAQKFPGGYDWLYTVVSALASQKHNPDGSLWFALSFFLSMLLLWPYVSLVARCMKPERESQLLYKFSVFCLRMGIIMTAVMGLERTVVYDLSAFLHKAHELIALLAFFGMYFGIICMLILLMFRNRVYLVPVLLVASPLFALAITQIIIYFDQRDIGWINTNWREMGISFWLSFALWQWIAIVFYWLGLGLLSLSCSKKASMQTLES